MASCSLIESIISSLKRELSAIIGDRLYLTTLFVLPMIMILFFGIMFYRGSIEGLPIAVVDRDHSVMSRKLQSMINSSAGVDIAYQPYTMDDAEALMLGGKITAIVYIEEGFEEDIYRGVTAYIECYLPGTNISASGIVERDIQQVVQTLSKGIALEKLQSIGVGYSQGMVDIMPIRVEANIISNPYLNYGYYLAPIFMIMGVIIFTILTTIYAIGRELRYATAKEWMTSAQDSLLGGLVGKLLPITLTMTLITQLIYGVLFIIMGIECQGSYIYLSLATVVFIIAYQAVGLLFISLTANMRLALSLGGGYGVMAFTFSGITFPTIAMYGVAYGASKLFPLTYFSEIFIDQAMRGVPIAEDNSRMVCLMLFVIIIPISWHRLRRVISNDKYWGKE